MKDLSEGCSVISLFHYENDTPIQASPIPLTDVLRSVRWNTKLYGIDHRAHSIFMEDEEGRCVMWSVATYKYIGTVQKWNSTVCIYHMTLCNKCLLILSIMLCCSASIWSCYLFNVTLLHEISFKTLDCCIRVWVSTN